MRVMASKALQMNKFVPASRFGFAVATADIQKALEQGNAAQVLGQVSQQDVLSNQDSKWTASFVKAVVAAGRNGENIDQHVSALDTFYRKNFRKLTFRQAFDVIEVLGEHNGQAAAGLEDSFWFWESLEEAVRGNVDEMTEHEYTYTFKAFAANFKGSTDLQDLLTNRVFKDHANLA